MEKKVPWNGALRMCNRAGSWETKWICITLRHNLGAPADIHGDAMGIPLICWFPLSLFLPCTRIDSCFSDIVCHLVDISYHFETVNLIFMYSTTWWKLRFGELCEGAGPGCLCAWWVFSQSGIPSDYICTLSVAGLKFCVKWKMNILVTFRINLATRDAQRASVLQAWNGPTPKCKHKYGRRCAIHVITWYQ